MVPLEAENDSCLSIAKKGLNPLFKIEQLSYQVAFRLEATQKFYFLAR